MSENDLVCSNEKCIYNPHGINKGNCANCKEGQLTFNRNKLQSSNRRASGVSG